MSIRIYHSLHNVKRYVLARLKKSYDIWYVGTVRVKVSENILFCVVCKVGLFLKKENNKK